MPGALEVYGKPNVRPVAVSPQLSDWYWLPSNLTATNALMVDYQPSDVAWMCTSPTLVAHLTVPYQVCRSRARRSGHLLPAQGSDPKIWGKLRNFS